MARQTVVRAETAPERTKKRPSRKGKNNSGSVFERKGRNKPWVAQITVDGNLKAYYFATKEEADDFRDDALYQLKHHGIKPPDRKQTVSDYVSHWLDLKTGITENVRATYKGHISRYLTDTHFGKMKLADVEPNDVRTFIKALQDRGLSSAYIQHVLTPINQAFEVAVDDSAIARNPIAKVKKPAPKKGAGKALTSEEVDSLLAAVRQDAHANRNYALYAFAFYTGARIGEILALRWRCIDWDSKTVRIDGSLKRERDKGLVIGPPKTDSSNRTLPLSPNLIEVLRKHRVAQNQLRLQAGTNWEDHDLTFCTYPDRNGTAPGGKPLEHSNIRRTWNRLLKIANLEGYRVYDSRHTFLTRLAEQGVNPDTARLIAGHTDVRTTLSYYTHTTNQMIRDAMSGILYSGLPAEDTDEK